MKFKLFFASFLLSLPLWWGINIFQDNSEQFFYAYISQPIQEINYADISLLKERKKLDIKAEAYISIKIDQNNKTKILYRENINQILPIASLTKIMTAIIVLDDKKNYPLTEILTISKKAAQTENASNFIGNLISGQKLSVRELLETMLVYSSNDAAFALAEEIEVKNFVQKMNQKADNLGLKKTYFMNPTGLSPENIEQLPNHSSCQDLISLSQYILKEQPLIFELSYENSYDLSIPKTQTIIGGKTGYTDEAGGCILLLLKDAQENILINLILGASSSETRIEEMQKLIK